MSRPKTYQKFTGEFKEEAVKLSRASGQSVRQVAQDLGMPPRTLELWRRQRERHGEAAFNGHAGRTADQVRIRELERELNEVKAERDFLEKAAAWFAKQPS